MSDRFSTPSPFPAPAPGELDPATVAGLSLRPQPSQEEDFQNPAQLATQQRAAALHAHAAHHRTMIDDEAHAQTAKAIGEAAEAAQYFGTLHPGDPDMPIKLAEGTSRFPFGTLDPRVARQVALLHQRHAEAAAGYDHATQATGIDPREYAQFDETGAFQGVDWTAHRTARLRLGEPKPGAAAEESPVQRLLREKAELEAGAQQQQGRGR